MYSGCGWGRLRLTSCLQRLALATCRRSITPPSTSASAISPVKDLVLASLTYILVEGGASGFSEASYRRSVGSQTGTVGAAERPECVRHCRRCRHAKSGVRRGAPPGQRGACWASAVSSDMLAAAETPGAIHTAVSRRVARCTRRLARWTRWSDRNLRSSHDGLSGPHEALDDLPISWAARLTPCPAREPVLRLRLFSGSRRNLMSRPSHRFHCRPTSGAGYCAMTRPG